MSICLLFGCSKKHYPQYLVTQVKDTTIVRTEYRDTIVRIPAKQILVTKDLPGDCPDFDTTVKKGTTTVNVSKKNGVLNVACKEDSLNVVIAGLNKEIFQLRSVKIEVPVAVPDPQPFIPKWVWYTMGALAAAAAWGNRNLIVRLVKIFSGIWK